MKNSKKVISLSMAAAMLASSATALAAVPMDTVIIGQTAFSLDAMAGDNADAINAEVQAALDAADSDAPIYFDLDGDEIDGFANLEDKTPMTAEQIAALGQITYKDGVNDDKVFESVDGDEVAQTDLTAYTAALNAVTEADYTVASWTEYQKVVTANPVTGANTEAEVKTATDAIVAAQGDLVSIHQLEVESVSAVNLKTFTVAFNAAIDEKTVDVAGDDATIKVYTNAGTSVTAISNTKLSDDGKSLVVELGAFNQSDSLRIVISGIKDANEKAVKDYDKTMVVTDTVTPETVSATAQTSKQVVVKFTEPISTTALGSASATLRDYLKVDGVKQVASYAVDNTTNEVTFTLGTSLAVGDHVLTIGQLADYAGFKTAEKALNVSVAEDSVGPKVTAVEMVTPSQVKVTFDEPVETANDGTLTVVEGNTTFTTTHVAVDSTKTIHTYDLSGNLGLAATVEATVKYYGTTDAEGNITGTLSAPAEFIFSVSDDTEKPTVAVTIDATNKLTLTFSESMSDAGKVVVKDKDGTTVATVSPSTFKADTDSKVVEISAATANLSNVDAANYTVTVTEAKDGSVRANEIAETVATVTTTDTKNPTLDSIIVTDNANDKFTVYFSEVMDASTLTNLDNYLVDLTGGGAFVSLTSITDATAVVGADGKTVVLTIPNAGTNTDVDIKGLSLKDTVGNTISNFNDKVDAASTGTFTHANITKVDLIAENQIKITSDVKWGELDPSALKVIDSTDANADEFVGVSGTVDETGLIYTVTLGGSLKADAKLSDGHTPKLATVDGQTTLKDFKGNALAITAGNAENIDDKVAPALESVKINNETDGNAGNAKIDLKFDEAVFVEGGSPSLSVYDFVVTDMTATGTPQLTVDDFAVSTSGDTVTIEVKKSGVVDHKFSVALNNGRYISDGSSFDSENNHPAAFAAQTVKNADATDALITERTAIVDILAVNLTVVNANTTTDDATDPDVITLVNDTTATNTKWADSGIVDGDTISIASGVETLTYTLQAGDVAKLEGNTSITITVGTTTTGVVYTGTTATAAAFDAAVVDTADTLTIKLTDQAGNVTTSAVNDPTAD